METTYVTQLLISSLIFAPGLFLLTVSLVVGLLMLLEKGGVLAAADKRQSLAASAAPLAGAGVNPAAGGIVADLRRTVETAAAGNGKHTAKAC